MRTVFIALSSVLAFVSYIVYIRAIVKGSAKPHRTTRFCTAIITIIAFASLLAQTSVSAVWLSGVFALGSVIIFLLSIRKGMGGWEPLDIACLVISLAGVALWQLTRDPVYGLMFSIGADLVSQIPMLVKTYRFPHTEVWTFYFLDVAAAAMVMLAAPKFSVQESVYPLYIMSIDGATILLILRIQIGSLLHVR